MPTKKKLSKKERARLEAEQCEILRIEMEKEKLKKIEEERCRKEREREQAMKRQQEEIIENRKRRNQLKQTMAFLTEIQVNIEAIQLNTKNERDWEKYMRCNGLPNANIPSDLRKYIHQWQSDIVNREKISRNWLLRTDERTLLTHDASVPDLTRATLRSQQGQLGDVYAQRFKEVLWILDELDEALCDKTKPQYTIDDLNRIKSEIRILLNKSLDDFTYKSMSYIERDMEIDRPGISKHIYKSEVFNSHVWTFSKDAQLVTVPKTRVGEQTIPTEIDFPLIDLQLTLPPSVQIPNSAIRGMWLNFDHFSDYCKSFKLIHPTPEHRNILIQTKQEWHKRKEILKSMLDACTNDSPTPKKECPDPITSQAAKDRSSNDVDKLYTEYEDSVSTLRRRGIGPEGLGLLPTDVNLRKYRIIGGVYCVDYLEMPEQDKRLTSKSFIKTIISPDLLSRKGFYETYKPPPPVQPGVRRLPEEIEAEMRMIETALDKLALVTLQLPDSVIWFEPPIACRWETSIETHESDLIEGIKQINTNNTAAVVTRKSFACSTATNLSPVGKSDQIETVPLPIYYVSDFDMFNIPAGIDLCSLIKICIVPRLPNGFCVQYNDYNSSRNKKHKKPTTLYLARHRNVKNNNPATDTHTIKFKYENRRHQITEKFVDYDEQNSLFPIMDFENDIRFHKEPNVIKNGINKNENNESVPSVELKTEASSQNTYMFSQLLEDLDRLRTLQLPFQEKALENISTKLSTSRSSSTATTTDTEKLITSNPHEKTMSMPSSMQYPLTTGFSAMHKEDEDLNLTESSSSDYSDDVSEILEQPHRGVGEVQSSDLNRMDLIQGGNRFDCQEYDPNENGKILNAASLTKGKWSVRDVHDTKFNEDKFSIQFRTGRLGIFGFALNRYSNMPYQTWEIKPDFKSPGSILFSLTASIVSIDMTITSAGYCVNSFQGGSTEAITNMIGKTMLLSELKSILVSSAVDIFPDEDAFCYTEGSCEKNFIMEMHLYTCMSTLGLTHNFSWSRWNLLAGRRTAVVLVRELMEGKKVPNYSTLLVTPLKSSLIECTEVSASFNAVGIPGMAYYADLHQLAQVHAHPISIEKQREMDPVLRDNVANILKGTRPLSFC